MHARMDTSVHVCEGGGGARGEEAEEERERTLILEDFRQKSSLTVCHRERDRDTEREL